MYNKDYISELNTIKNRILEIQKTINSMYCSTDKEKIDKWHKVYLSQLNDLKHLIDYRIDRLKKYQRIF